MDAFAICSDELTSAREARGTPQKKCQSTRLPRSSPLCTQDGILRQPGTQSQARRATRWRFRRHELKPFRRSANHDASQCNRQHAPPRQRPAVPDASSAEVAEQRGRAQQGPLERRLLGKRRARDMKHDNARGGPAKHSIQPRNAKAESEDDEPEKQEATSSHKRAGWHVGTSVNRIWAPIQISSCKERK